jgi:Kef-type K+ transport system membrane component KefB
MGISMSVTAFPVLARILAERKMLNTPIGSMALTCAAVDDVTAWTLLAVVVAVVTSGGVLVTVAWTVLLTGAFVAAMILIVRPVMRPLLASGGGADQFDKERLALAITLALGSAIATELIGVHALFGAFVAGATLPVTDAVRADLHDRLEGFSSVILLPLFFAFTGLRTEFALVNDTAGVLMCLGIIALAMLGKFGGSAISARLTGMTWPNAFVLGALMNTRGLMELIVLNVGYDLGVIPAEMFTALVVMALVTTMMTGPLVDLVSKRAHR